MTGSGPLSLPSPPSRRRWAFPSPATGPLRHGSIRSTARSRGYFAPECYDREFSKKSDVYSLGVVIMEIMSGKKFPTPKEVIASWRNRREKWEEDIPLEHVKACADIGAMCINHIAEERPTTQHIIKVLKDLGDTDEFKEAGSSNSLESQMDEKTRIAYDVLKRMLLDESEEPKELPLSLLEAITNNFSDELELSRAGFAVVYKLQPQGMLGTRTVSVKKLAGMIDMDENQFSKEVQCLMKVRHKNIVRFLGYCVDTKSEAAEFGRNSVLAGVQNRVFCFEYASNGNLNKHITGQIIGYWAPEFHTGETTFKSDIYSLGLIIMEILTGEKRFSTDEEVRTISAAKAKYFLMGSTPHTIFLDSHAT
ncbi:hypothetical protein PR202_ga12868 [Eleusine coracana subsp. coracana]|uniref:Protein kinase domain-containing protein n=1 Tax=Eleusine coracana subsp. coracana TaxID=191504 RepID=A0AAV5CDB5_ELECO|nr:hypothetical protein PR202_ga12868 [Eleusine coracana subsp. coracana]